MQIIQVHTNLHKFQRKEQKRIVSSTNPLILLCQISLVLVQVLSPNEMKNK